ncbi:Right origin-binding protein [Roseibium album]|nr:Right origin-binding protein [Roseibium album]
MNVIRQRLEKVLSEMDRTLEQPMDVAAFADIAAYSRFHFQRLFSAFLGTSVSEYRRLLLFKRAGHQLAFRLETSVTEIAYDAGYENLESFTRAFKRIFGQSPTEFRSAPDWAIWHQTYLSLTELKEQIMPAEKFDLDSVRIVEFPVTDVASLEHRGAQVDLPDTVQKFISWRKAHGMPPSKSATFNILYDDPKETDPAEFRFDICCAVSDEVTENDFGVVSKSIPEGRCAVIRHVGSLDFAEGKIRALYRDWLPQSGEEPRDFPLFVQRLTFFPDVLEHEAETDIYLPLC